MDRCKVCTSKRLQEYIVEERMLNKGERFRYQCCRKCGTLFLAEEVPNIGQYYKGDYYSFHLEVPRKSRMPVWIKRIFINSFIFGRTCEPIVQRLMPSEVVALGGTRAKKEEKILDVGCGNGSLIYLLNQNGYLNTVGIDLYCKETPYPVNFYQSSLYDIHDKEKYDVIMFNHSFEHMENPKEILDKVAKLLSDKGRCIIRVPVGSCEAWKRYSVHWYQIDAPRHYFLYSPKALSYLCKKAGLEIYHVLYTGGVPSFVISEMYRDTGFSYSEIVQRQPFHHMGMRQKLRYWWDTIRASHKGMSDTAAFYIRKKRG